MICLLLAALLSGPLGAEPFDLQTPELELRLETTSSGLPFIAQVVWRDTGEVAFTAGGPGAGPANWARDSGLTADVNAPASGSAWTVSKDDLFQRAHASWRAGSIEVISHVDLAGRGRMIRVYTELVNHGAAVNIPSFPIWMTRVKHPAAPALRWWEALSYVPRQTRLAGPPSLTLQSRTYSSDARGSDGQVPFWMLLGEGQGLGFGLAWSGGWQATFAASSDGLDLQLSLPPEETQLRLGAGERIVGPALEIVPLRGADEAERRRQWLQERQASAHRRWAMPEPGHPLIYNHWYSAGRDLSREFLIHQLEALQPYGFDVFVLDDGWFEQVGQWTPAPEKFEPGELESFFALVREKDIQAGIWSCPWLVHAEPNALPPEVDRPPFLRAYMQAYALDLVGYDFTSRLLDHIRSLKAQFGIDWWKYDQELFGQTSRHGKMRNILALQDALAAVRRRYPDLAIENCMSGGRMINAFTDAIARVHWIRDGGRTGYAHARSNVQEAFGAVDFLMPAKVQRWTNRPNEVADEEVLRCYCRSAMIGVWGISADLHKVGEAQRKVILSEVKHYRRLNQLKASLRYEIQYPQQNQKLVSIVFYDDAGSAAGVLAFRLHSDGPIEEPLQLQGLARDRGFDVTDADRKVTVRMRGGDLAEAGLPITLAEGELSRIYFLEAAPVEEDRSIEIWYGPRQSFGQVGEAQAWINILGRVRGVESLEALRVAIHGGPAQTLSTGSDRHRLARPGDFNAELPWDGFHPGENSVRFHAEWRDGSAAHADVTLQIERGRRWPLPYAVDFSSVKDLQAAVQVVDGRWVLTQDGVRTAEPYYDRVLCLGDASWTDFEATVLLTLHGFTPPAPGPPTYNVTHVGVALRWRGHTQDERQPSRQWYPLGAQGELLIGPDLPHCRWRILPNEKQRIYAGERNAVALNRPFRVKAQVATLADGRSRYRFKQWMDGDPEPQSWDVTACEPGASDFPSGSLCLVPHNTDVTIHEVRVEPLLGAVTRERAVRE